MAEQSSETDDSDKTEQPSQRKLEQALEKGQVVTSREVNSFLMLLFFTLLFMWILPATIGDMMSYLSSIIENSHNISDIGKILKSLVHRGLMALLPLFLMVIFVSFFSAFVQRGHFVMSAEQITPDLSRISMLSGFKRIFSLASVVELLKGIVKVSIVGLFIYLVVMSYISDLVMYSHFSHDVIIKKMLDIVRIILICVCIASAAIAGLDYGYQFYKHMKSLKMSKHEMKEEYKDTEGNPEIKGKRRALQRSMSKKRMMSAVSNATVVVTNPDHYSIALQYDKNANAAPIVIAKGLDLIALKIKEIAKENDVPIVENPPLARALYKTTEVDSEIPSEHYEAVAKIISYVYHLKNKKV